MTKEQLENAIHEMIMQLENLNRSTEIAIFIRDNGRPEITDPYRGPRCYPGEVLVIEQGWDSEALADYDGCEGEVEEQEEREGARSNLIDDLCDRCLLRAEIRMKELGVEYAE